MDEKKKTGMIKFDSGYTVKTNESESEGTLTVHAPDGRLCLKVVLTPAGPVIEMESVSLKLVAQKELSLQCESMEIQTEKDMTVKAGGSLIHTARENINLTAAGMIRTDAFTQRLSARRGDFEVQANDDVMLDGERIRLNSPKSPSVFMKESD